MLNALQARSPEPATAHLPASQSAIRTLVSLENGSLSLSGRPIIENVSLTVRAGEIVTLIGPNGAGKTTLARVLLGLIPLNAGTLSRGSDVNVGYAPQRFAIDRSMPLSVRRFMTLNNKLRAKDVTRALDETGAGSLIEAQLADLSGGEFQRVLLARALSRNPDLLVLDEPAQALDFPGAAQLYELIDRIRRLRRCGILLISHDLHIVLGASDRVICLNRHICCEGVPGAVAGHPEYIRLFGRDAASSLGVYKHTHDHCHALSGQVVDDRLA